MTVAQAREHWSSRLGFLFAAIGSAVGLGVLWKFPFTVGQNGGGLFLLAYLLCTIGIGIPVFTAELLLGRRTQRAAIGAFTKLTPDNTFWKCGGWLGVMASFFIMSYYSVIAGWGLSYFFMFLCGFYKGKSALGMRNVFLELSQSGGISVLWHALFTTLSTVVVYSGVRKGIEKTSRIFTKALLIMLIGLVFANLRMDGFSEALRFVFYPNVANFRWSSVVEALGLSFFTLSLGQGIMFSYGSYLQREESIPTMVCTVVLSVIIVAILAALVIFPVVFTFGFKPSMGTGLVFETLPFLFVQLPGTMIIACTFFALFVFTALTSAIAFIEVVATNLMELTGISRHRAVIGTACATFIVGIPSAYAPANGVFPDWAFIYGTDFLTTMENLVSIWLIPLGGLCTSIYVGWVVDEKELSAEYCTDAIGYRTYALWYNMMRWVVPVLIFLIILEKSGVLTSAL